MLKIYNKQAITKNQRFTNALIYAIPASIAVGLLYGIIARVAMFEFSIVFLGIGYFIGYVIQTKGRGVQNRFSILGAVLAIVCFILADLIAMGGFGVFSSLEVLLLSIENWGRYMLYSLNSFKGVLSVGFRVFGVIAAYQNSRIV